MEVTLSNPLLKARPAQMKLPRALAGRALKAQQPPGPLHHFWTDFTEDLFVPPLAARPTRTCLHPLMPLCTGTFQAVPVIPAAAQCSEPPWAPHPSLTGRQLGPAGSLSCAPRVPMSSTPEALGCHTVQGPGALWLCLGETPNSAMLGIRATDSPVGP